jgi:hypothetical protein
MQRIVSLLRYTAYRGGGFRASFNRVCWPRPHQARPVAWSRASLGFEPAGMAEARMGLEREYVVGGAHRIAAMRTAMPKAQRQLPGRVGHSLPPVCGCQGRQVRKGGVQWGET